MVTGWRFEDWPTGLVPFDEEAADAAAFGDAQHVVSRVPSVPQVWDRLSC
jgi:hypothetical protein